jgi:hypothetical protein
MVVLALFGGMWCEAKSLLYPRVRCQLFDCIELLRLEVSFLAFALFGSWTVEESFLITE